MVIPTRVRFKGQKYVWLREDGDSGALAYPEQVDESGNVHAGAVFLPSFAHVFSGVIVSRQNKIGTVSDLQIDGVFT